MRNLNGHGKYHSTGRYVCRWISTLPLLALSQVAPAYALISGLPLIGTPDLVRILFKDGSMCTGAFVDGNTILTAAHCLANDPEGNSPVLEKVLSEDDQSLGVKALGFAIHPKYNRDSWPKFDVGLIKTTAHSRFAGNFKIYRGVLPFTGKAKLLGCGISNFEPKIRARLSGQNRFIRMGAVLLFIGRANNPLVADGRATSVAQNDSGAPVLDLESGLVIAVATQASARESARYHLPAVSLATSITEITTQAFLSSHLGDFR